MTDARTRFNRGQFVSMCVGATAQAAEPVSAQTCWDLGTVWVAGKSQPTAMGVVWTWGGPGQGSPLQ